MEQYSLELYRRITEGDYNAKVGFENSDEGRNGPANLEAANITNHSVPKAAHCFQIL